MAAAKLSYRCALDWIELEILTVYPTNRWTVQRAIKRAVGLSGDANAHVAAMDEGKGGSATVFRFRVHDPQNAQHVGRILERLCGFLRACGPSVEAFKGRCTVTAVELAFDTYLPVPTQKDLAKIVADRYRFLARVPTDRWHIYRMGRQHREPVNAREENWDLRGLVRQLGEGWQIADTADKAADVRYHGYVKTSDNGRQLPQSEWRARFEVTLRGPALPMKTFRDLAVFNFAKLAKYFKWGRLSDNMHPAAKHAANFIAAPFGRPGRYRRPSKDPGRYSGVSVYRKGVLADSALNAQAYECLRGLSQRWIGKNSSRADLPGKISAKTPAISIRRLPDLTIPIFTKSILTLKPFRHTRFLGRIRIGLSKRWNLPADQPRRSVAKNLLTRIQLQHRQHAVPP